jgi:hypothetical protein
MAKKEIVKNGTLKPNGSQLMEGYSIYQNILNINNYKIFQI